MSGLPLWLGTVPDYEIVDGQMQVTVGDFKLAMPINVFIVGCAKGEAAIAKWRIREMSRPSAEVIQLERHQH
jgi:hypothetical protein